MQARKKSFQFMRLRLFCFFGENHFPRKKIKIKGSACSLFLYKLFPFDGARRFRGNVENHAVDAADFVDDSCAHFCEYVFGDA